MKYILKDKTSPKISIQLSNWSQIPYTELCYPKMYKVKFYCVKIVHVGRRSDRNSEKRRMYSIVRAT